MLEAFEKALATGADLNVTCERLLNQQRTRHFEQMQRIQRDCKEAELIKMGLAADKASYGHAVAVGIVRTYQRKYISKREKQEQKRVLKSLEEGNDEHGKAGKADGNNTERGCDSAEAILSTPIPEIEP